ncbi:MAG: hypothetical protein Q7S10_01650 [bacterium]|nr:hypothetical protein [bacterium]
MNKKLAIISLFLLAVPTLSLAVQYDATTAPSLPYTISDFWQIITRVLNFIWPVFVGMAIIMFFISAFLFLTSAGDPGKLRGARDSLIWATVGMILGIMAVSFPFIIGTAIGL